MCRGDFYFQQIDRNVLSKDSPAVGNKKFAENPYAVSVRERGDIVAYYAICGIIIEQRAIEFWEFVEMFEIILKNQFYHFDGFCFLSFGFGIQINSVKHKLMQFFRRFFESGRLHYGRSIPTCRDRIDDKIVDTLGLCGSENAYAIGREIGVGDNAASDSVLYVVIYISESVGEFDDLAF